MSKDANILSVAKVISDAATSCLRARSMTDIARVCAEDSDNAHSANLLERARDEMQTASMLEWDALSLLGNCSGYKAGEFDKHPHRASEISDVLLNACSLAIHAESSAREAHAVIQKLYSEPMISPQMDHKRHCIARATSEALSAATRGAAMAIEAATSAIPPDNGGEAPETTELQATYNGLNRLVNLADPNTMSRDREPYEYPRPSLRRDSSDSDRTNYRAPSRIAGHSGMQQMASNRGEHEPRSDNDEKTPAIDPYTRTTLIMDDEEINPISGGLDWGE